MKWDFRYHPVEDKATTHHMVGRFIEEGMPVDCVTAECDRVYLNKRTGEVEGDYARGMCKAHYQRWKRMYDAEFWDVYNELSQMEWYKRNVKDQMADHNRLMVERHAIIRSYMRMNEENGWRPVGRARGCRRGVCVGKHYAKGLCAKHSIWLSSL